MRKRDKKNKKDVCRKMIYVEKWFVSYRKGVFVEKGCLQKKGFCRKMVFVKKEFLKKSLFIAETECLQKWGSEK